MSHFSFAVTLPFFYPGSAPETCICYGSRKYKIFSQCCFNVGPVSSKVVTIRTTPFYVTLLAVWGIYSLQYSIFIIIMKIETEHQSTIFTLKPLMDIDFQKKHFFCVFVDDSKTSVCRLWYKLIKKEIQKFTTCIRTFDHVWL